MTTENEMREMAERGWEEDGTELAVLRPRAEQMERSLRNVLALATRMKRRLVHHKPENVIADCDHLIRFCREAGVEPSVLRAPAGRPIPYTTTDLRGSPFDPAPTDPNRPRAKR